VANLAALSTVLVFNYLMRATVDVFGVDVVVPYSVIVLGGMLTVSGMGLVRFRSRLFSFRRVTGGSPILVVGMSREAAAFARQASQLPGGGHVVGFVADNGFAADSARRLAGLPILGTVAQLGELTERYSAEQIVVVGNHPARTREVVDRCLDIDVRLRILPGAEDVMLNRSSTLDVRDIRVEDILVRPPVQTDLNAAMNLIKGRRILVTGAGGSIGSEVVRQLLDFEPAGVWALDRDETLLHEASLHWNGPTTNVLCDIRDSMKVARSMEKIQPDLVFHAAALKHVPMLESEPEEAVLTNIVGTRNVIEAGSRFGMSHFILISTDKAVNPTSVMGASKRVAELMTQAGNERRDGCVYTAVRFGNVLGSRGSVVPTFVEQIKLGGPVTVTDANMTRYFMTVDEAVQLVLHAATLSQGSEVFLLDMGDPVRILDLANRLIRLGGLLPERDIGIRYTGVRPGEKLTETLAIGPLGSTTHPKILEVKQDGMKATALFGLIADLEESAVSGDRARLHELLKSLASASIDDADDAVDLGIDHLDPAWS
jgi:FlaA1/EpsC-like NDP-sugar epimerase